jgi:hypothetical protein
MSINDNLWPDIPSTDIVTPKSILVRQANFLGEKTKNVVLGEVTSAGLSDNKTIQHLFWVVAPALSNYKYILFTLRHGIELYPLVLTYKDNNLKIENEEDLLNHLKDIFNDESTIKMINALVAQSIEE